MVTVLLVTCDDGVVTGDPCVVEELVCTTMIE